MKRKYLRLTGIVMLIGAMACILAYGAKTGEVSLPDVVKAAINKLYPKATIEEAEVEEEGVKVYEIELKQDGQEFEVTVAPDGTIIETEAEITLADVPEAVKAAVAGAAGGAEVKDICKEITYAVVKLVALDKPQTTYEAEVVIDGQEVELKLAADGTILSREVEDDDDDEGDDDDEDDNDDEDEDEQEVSIDEVPEAVKATILKEAAGAEIKEVEMEIEDGKTIYEAEVIVDGQEVEIKVAADGTLLGKEVEDEDDEDDDEEE